MKNNLHLTLSNILIDQNSDLINEVSRLQGILKKGLSDFNLVSIPESNIIHHSLVDFLPAVEFHNHNDVVNFKLQHRKLVKEIDSFASALIQNIKDRDVFIYSSYKGEKSIALEAYPSKDILTFANLLVDKIKTFDGYPQVKGFPQENPYKFAINIIRFFRNLIKVEDENFLKSISKINNELKVNPIRFQLKKLSLVVSDDYLTNTNPVERKFNLK